MPKRPKKEPAPYPRPLLTEMIQMYSKLAKRDMTKKEWNEAFFEMSIEPIAPQCIKDLVWDTSGDYPRSQDLEDFLNFCDSINRTPRSFF